MRLGDVIERHHHDAQKQHRWDRSDPIPVGGENAVLISRTRPTHQFQRAQVGGQEAETGYPCRHLPSGHEKVFAGIGPPAKVKPDRQNQGEVESDDDHIHRRQMHKPACAIHRYCWHHFFSFACP